ncbi:MAG TPA: nucleotidyltransferase domain-containing protein [Candidatus Dormibacteraeota bacterium]|nr:nucleotidyltransferase domain-containing protein [Candidatus Dormibacteraeota bacterium]
MFTPEFRAHVRERLIEMAESDGRVESAAAVGGSAEGEVDRWSDIDLSFGLAKDASIDAVLVDWTKNVRDEFAAVTLFDLPFRSSVYRVFLLPGSLQVDLSFTPGSDFGAHTPRFQLLFGHSVEKEHVQPPPRSYEFGLAAHHAVRAQLSIERGRLWQAEYWVSAVRDHALTLACLRLGLPSEYGRGFDRLPESIRAAAEKALVRSLETEELKRALRAAVETLLSESKGVHEDAPRVEAMLLELVSV